MKSRIGKKAALVLAGLLLTQAVSMQVMMAETADGTVRETETETETGAESKAKAETEVKAAPEAKAESAAPAAASESAASSENAEPSEPAAAAPAPETPAAAEPEAPAAPTEAANGPESESGEEADAENAAETETGTEEETEGETEALTEGGETELQRETEAVKTDDVEAEDVEEKTTEKEKDKTEDAHLSGVTFRQDGHGAYYTYNSDHNRSLTLSLHEGSSPIGHSVTISSSAPSESICKYFLELDNNMFGLSPSDIGKTITLQIDYVTESGNELQCRTTEEIMLSEPSLSLPSLVNYSVLKKTEDLYNVEVVSGVSWTNGSCVTRRIVEKQSGGSWKEVPDGKAYTSADAGLYRVHILTCLSRDGYYSNEVRVAVPVADIEFDGDASIGSKITAKPVGPDGCDAEVQSIEWYYGDETALKGSELTFTSSLKDCVDAQTTSLRVVVKDMIGNTFTKYVTLKPLDLSKASLTPGDYEHPEYDGDNQMPDAALLFGDYQIPEALYTAVPATDKNSVNAGDAWMKVTGDGTYLGGTGYVKFVIDPAETEVEEEDFTTSFEYDGKDHMPVLKGSAAKIGKLKYKKWQKKNADGTWTDISGAPTDPGTYRVNVTVKPKDRNYAKAVFKKMEFTIKGELPTEQTPQEKPVDMSVTDAAGNPVGYTASVLALTDDQGNDAGHVYKISADPDKKGDGSVLVDGNGKSVYHLRNLNITPELIRRVKNEGCEAVRFVVGDGAVQISIDALNENAAYTLVLAPLADSELKEDERAAAEGYDRLGGFYAMKLKGAEADLERVKEQGISVYYSIGSDAQKAGILFFEEDRLDPGSILMIAENTSMITKENGMTYVSAPGALSGIFTAAS